MPDTVIDRDLGLRRFLRELDHAKTASVVIGLQEGDTAHGQTIAEYAAYNEFGTSKIPERSFLRSTFDERLEVMRRMMASQYDSAMEGRTTIYDALRRIGLQHETDVKQKIRDLKTPPNAPATIAKKGSANPLIDTGAMVNAVRYVLRLK